MTEANRTSAFQTAGDPASMACSQSYRLKGGLDRNNLLTRRETLKRLGAGALLSLGLWPGCLDLKARTSAPGSFRFLAVNDTHYLTPDCGVWLEAVVRQMRGEGADFCLVCGDLTEKGQPEHLAAVREIFKGLGTPVFPVIGNHDYSQQDDRRGYEELFPGRLNYWFEHRGWQFVGLDSTDGLRYEKIDIQPATLRWLDLNLRRLDPSKPTVIFTHFPLGEAVTYRPGNTDEVLERLRPFNLKGLFSGHWHGFTLRWREGVFAVTNRCCALKRGNHDRTPAKGYMVCEARDGIVTYRFVECRLPVPEQAPLEALKK